MKRGKSAAETCRLNGWVVGTRLIGDEGYGDSVIRITAIGVESILAICEQHADQPCRYSHEATWTLTQREWREATP